MPELGRGFMFVGSNVHIPVGDGSDFADMVFCCRPLRGCVAIELQADKLMSFAVGRIDECLSCSAIEVNDEYGNPPIGIIPCTAVKAPRIPPPSL